MCRLGAMLIVAALSGALALGAATAAQVAGPFPVNTFTVLNQWLPSIGRLADGDFVVVWRSDRQRPNPEDHVGDIYGQRFAAKGSKRGGEFPINTTTVGAQSVPVVAVLADGTFVAVWVSDHESDSGFAGVYGQRFAAGGTRLGGEFRVHRFTPGTANNPAIAALSDGSFVVAWADSPDGADAVAYDLFAQRFSAEGEKLGRRFRVNRKDTGAQWRVHIAGLADGGFVAVWDSANETDGTRAIRGQRYGADGTRTGGQFTVVSRALDQRRPRVSALDDGFVVVWEGFTTKLSYNIFAQRYSGAGEKAGERIRVAPKDANQINPAVSGLSDGAFLVAWTDDLADIFARRFAADGIPTGPSFRINGFANQVRDWAVIAPSEGGGFTIAWDDSDGSGLGVFARVFKP